MITSLPSEIINLILESLVRDEPTALWDLCLVGNHRLYHLALPFTWKVVHFIVNHHDDNPTGQLKHYFDGFMANDKRVRAVRYLRFTFVGYHYHYETRAILKDEYLARLINVTHARVSFIGVDYGDVDATGDIPMATVNLLGGYLPSLVSLQVEGCYDRYNLHHDESWSFYELVPTLRHVATRYCEDGLSAMWSHAPNLQVLEVDGGDMSAFWIETMQGEPDPMPGFPEAPEVAIIDVEKDVLPRLTRIYLYDEEFNYGIYSLEELTDPLPLLEEFVLDKELQGDFGRAIWHGFMKLAPNLKRLRLTVAHHSICRDSHTSFGDQSISGSMQSLEELCLLASGVDDDKFIGRILQSSAPNLQALYLEGLTDLDVESMARLVAIVEEWAEGLPSLNLVVWPRSVAVLVRREGHMITGELVVDDFRFEKIPEWAAKPRGIGEWWEDHFRVN
ncbi:hypothetical protein HGRIS_011592 [Hohenbuehelia grisea]|uniref:F-box domain-containing protein n=1 Tax=Hohenbuehelia grisea TaxID=104357 RepID=A0ABR3JXS0_9AGAR